MNFERKKARAIAILEGKKMRRRKYAPLFLRVLWRMGFKIPPCPALPFASFWQRTLIIGIPFALIWGTVMWLTVWRIESLSSLDALIRSLVVGIAVGATMARRHHWREVIWDSPAWKDL